jgi:hypothetical protein
MTDWSQLSHAYGPADDVPALLAQAEADRDGQAWEDLWSRLCHQGTVYSASFAALPTLTEIAGRWSPAERMMALALAGDIVASSDQAHGRVNVHASYPSEIARLKALTEETLQDGRLAGDSDMYVHVLQALLAFEGVAFWGEHLEGLNDEEYEVTCPQCDAETMVAFGEHGAFTTQDDMYMRNTDTKRLPLLPADPAALTGIGRRLHDRAMADGQAELATKLTYVFGRADCVTCGERFRVDKAVVAQWGEPRLAHLATAELVRLARRPLRGLTRVAGRLRGIIARRT